MHLSEITRDYRVAFRHNPKHFYPGSFRIEAENRRLIVVAVVKRHVGKNYRVVGILKRKRET